MGATYLDDLCGDEAGLGVAFAAHIVESRVARVLDILGAGEVFEVRALVVMLHPVNMVDFFPDRAWPEERTGDEAVNEETPSLIALIEGDGAITLLVGRKGQHSSRSRASGGGAPLHVPLLTDEIDALVPADVPPFHAPSIHPMGVPRQSPS